MHYNLRYIWYLEERMKYLLLVLIPLFSVPVFCSASPDRPPARSPAQVMQSAQPRVEESIIFTLTKNIHGRSPQRDLGAWRNLRELTLDSGVFNSRGDLFDGLVLPEGLRSLDVSDIKLPEQKLRVLLQKVPAGITQLIMKRCDLGPNEALVLREESIRFQQLTSLDLMNNGFGKKLGVDGAKYIAEIEGLQKLNISHNEVGDEGTAHLAKMLDLMSLDLERSGLTADGVAQLKALPRLQHLSLSRNELPDAAMAQLPRFPRLISLDVGFNKLTQEGLRAISKIEKLERLVVDNIPIGDDGLHQLTFLSELSGLSAAFCGLTPAGARHFSQFPKMRYLNLYANSLGANTLRRQISRIQVQIISVPGYARRGLEAIANLRELQNINLGCNDFRGNDLYELMESPSLENIWLLSNNNVSQEVRFTLRRHFGNAIRFTW